MTQGRAWTASKRGVLHCELDDTSVASGCDGNIGFFGSMIAIMVASFYVSTCIAVSFPANSDDTSLTGGCDCNAGFCGLGTVATIFLFYTSICVVVVCFANYDGTDNDVGCASN